MTKITSLTKVIIFIYDNYDKFTYKALKRYKQHFIIIQIMLVPIMVSVLQPLLLGVLRLAAWQH
jgi:hypothetical protein